MVDLEYYGVIYPFGKNDGLLASVYPGSQVFYKILITMVACFAVAFLSSFLSEQVRKTRRELRTMGDHVKRVEKMASIGGLAAGIASAECEEKICRDMAAIEQELPDVTLSRL